MNDPINISKKRQEKVRRGHQSWQVFLECFDKIYWPVTEAAFSAEFYPPLVSYTTPSGYSYYGVPSIYTTPSNSGTDETSGIARRSPFLGQKRTFYFRTPKEIYLFVNKHLSFILQKREFESGTGLHFEKEKKLRDFLRKFLEMLTNDKGLALGYAEHEFKKKEIQRLSSLNRGDGSYVTNEIFEKVLTDVKVNSEFYDKLKNKWEQCCVLKTVKEEE